MHINKNRNSSSGRLPPLLLGPTVLAFSGHETCHLLVPLVSGHNPQYPNSLFQRKTKERGRGWREGDRSREKGEEGKEEKMEEVVVAVIKRSITNNWVF